jgi:hypothetical protein
VLPIGCYDISRFESQAQMQEQILRLSSDHAS